MPAPDIDRDLKVAAHFIAGRRWSEAREILISAIRLYGALDSGAPSPGAINGSVFSEAERRVSVPPPGRGHAKFRPRLVALAHKLGEGLTASGRHEEAAAFYHALLSLDPDEALAWNNLGSALLRLGKLAQARKAIDKALVLRPDYATARLNLAILLERDNEPDAALEAYRAASEAAPEDGLIRGLLFRALRSACDWRDIAVVESRLLALCRRSDADHVLSRTSPFQVLLMAQASPADLFAAGRARAASIASSVHRLPPADVKKQNRLHIAYMSADFHRHPVGRLFQDLPRYHDRERFIVSGYSIGTHGERDAERHHIAAGCDHFHDVAALDDSALTKRIRDDGVDILVDLMGFTRGARPAILARRPAPLQVGYLGYPGTTGAPWLDYILCDRIVAPEDHAQFYSEKLVHLPGCYLPYPSTKPGRPVITPSRKEAGLPGRGFVFACFNSENKIEPQVFEAWMRILGRVPSSLLWLRNCDANVQFRLRAEAKKRGIESDRLIFAPLLPFPKYRARLPRAGLFLDTFHYNGHSTVADALTMGVPVLTVLGATFANRVSASLLRAVGLDDLVAANDENYVKIAVELATEPNRLRALRRRLAKLVKTSKVFDSRAKARDLDQAYLGMWERYRGGMDPQGFKVESE